MKRFLTDETGTVTVDWVVLTAGVAGLGLLVFVAIRSGATAAATETADHLDYDTIQEVVSGPPGPYDVARAAAFEHHAYDTEEEIEARLDLLLDPDAIPDVRLERQAGNWQAKADDPTRTDGQRRRARDEVKLYKIAKDARGL